MYIITFRTKVLKVAECLEYHHGHDLTYYTRVSSALTNIKTRPPGESKMCQMRTCPWSTGKNRVGTERWFSISVGAGVTKDGTSDRGTLPGALRKVKSTSSSTSG